MGKSQKDKPEIVKHSSSSLTSVESKLALTGAWITRLADLKHWPEDPQRLPLWTDAILRSGLSLKAIDEAFKDYLTYGTNHPALAQMNSFPEPAHIVAIGERFEMKWAQEALEGEVARELAELKEREAQGEKFYGMADLAEAIRRVSEGKKL